LVVVAPLCASPVAAQDGPVLEEVLVTAQKRSESLQDAAVAVSAFTDKIRDQLGISSIQDFTNFTPGITYSTATDRMFVRGIGRYTNNLATSPGIATYGDGVYNSSNHQADSTALFTERVEVLRGPQGTLYGRNSIGGALNVLLKRPTQKLDAEVRAVSGSQERRIGEVLVRGPLSEAVGFLVGAGRYMQDEGYVENIGGNDEEGKLDNYYGVAQLAVRFGAAADLWVRYTYTQWDEGWGTNVNTFPYVTSTNNRCVPSLQTGGICASLVNPGSLGPSALYNSGVGYRLTQMGSVVPFNLLPTSTPYLTLNPGATHPRQVNHDQPNNERLDPDHSLVMELTGHLGWADLKWVGGYHQYRYTLFTDFDNSTRTSYIYAPPLPAPFAAPVEIFTQVQSKYVEDKRYYSNELDLTSTSNSALQWIVGLYQYHERYQQPVSVSAAAQTQLRAPLRLVRGVTPGTTMLGGPGAANPSSTYSFNDAHITNTSLAGFGQLDYAFTEHWKGTLGLRYTRDKKYGDEFARFIFWDPGLQGGLAPVFDISDTTFGINGGVLGADGKYTRHLADHWDALTGTAGMEWRPVAGTLAYLKYTRGYKDGGLNAGGIVALPYTDPEYVNAYELGIKQEIGRALVLNTSLFFYDYRGAQIPLAVPRPTGPNVTQTFNIDARSLGVEVESIWQATDALRLLLNYSFLDTELNSGSNCFADVLDSPITGIGPRPCVTNLGSPGQSVDGNRVPGSPRNKVAFNATYTWSFTPGSLRLSASWVWRDTTYSSIFTRREWLAPSYDQTDARLSWEDARGRFTMIGYVRNAFDDLGFDTVSAQSTAAGITRSFSLTPPRQYGLELQYRFGR
jgi:iron complex outermembrane recepter protein